MLNIKCRLVCALAISTMSGGMVLAAEADLQKQIDEVRSALPKFDHQRTDPTDTIVRTAWDPACSAAT